MSTLTGRIERYLKNLLEVSDCNQVELKRSELAQTFMCVPSQINYVLETRFRDEQGYHVVSRRGAGGYFQIIRLEVTNDEELRKLIGTISERPMDYRSAEGLLSRLQQEDFISKREHMMLSSVLSESSLAGAGDNSDMVRSAMLKNILITLLRVDC
jgi:transcriptional regulator CtsR